MLEGRVGNALVLVMHDGMPMKEGASPNILSR